MGRKVVAIESRIIDGILVEGKPCSQCREFKSVNDYGKDSARKTGIKPRCKHCEAVNSRNYREGNKAKVVEYNRKYYEGNKEYYAEYQRNSRRENKDVYNAYKQIRRARKRNLPDTLTSEQVDMIKLNFNGKCALTGEDSFELDHFVAISTEHGGTVYENMIPLSRKLNASKGDKNPFEWFAQNKDRFNLSEEKFDYVVGYLAELNGMRYGEYISYVNDCYAKEVKPCAFA